VRVSVRAYVSHVVPNHCPRMGGAYRLPGSRYGKPNDLALSHQSHAADDAILANFRVDKVMYTVHIL